jgi:hypothetical protein
VDSLWLPRSTFGSEKTPFAPLGEKTNRSYPSINHKTKDSITMTKTHYQSRDKIIEIITTTDDARFPRHPAPMAVMRIRPQPHTRAREESGMVTLMIRFGELRALAEAVALCDESFTFSMSKTAQDKPEERRERWLNYNKKRTSAHQANVKR